MPNRFCAICGNEIDASAPHYGMCLDCYLKENPLFKLEDSFSINICLDCLSYSKKQDWYEPEVKDKFYILEKALERFILKPYLKNNNIFFEIQFDEENFEYSSKDLLKTLNAKIIGSLKENPQIKHTEEIRININYELCDNCQKIRGGSYYTAIIQLRVKSEEDLGIINNILKDIEQYTEKLFEKDPRHFISQIKDQTNGIDLYLSTNELMNYLISFLNNKYNFLLKRSKKLVGRNNQKGKNIYRLKALIKLLPINKGDRLLINNIEYLVDTILKNKIILKDQKGEKTTKNYQFFFSVDYKKIT
jgi:NMD protein affecting ribosome stability and mRNA decay